MVSRLFLKCKGASSIAMLCVHQTLISRAIESCKLDLEGSRSLHAPRQVHSIRALQVVGHMITTKFSQHMSLHIEVEAKNFILSRIGNIDSWTLPLLRNWMNYPLFTCCVYTYLKGWSLF